MPRHPFDLISKRYQLRTVFLVTTGICLALWLATFTVGRILLGLLAAVGCLILALACATWVLGTVGERQNLSKNSIANDARSDLFPEKDPPPAECN
jgi:hypothetical protein